jgi:hypothetical protein
LAANFSATVVAILDGDTIKVFALRETIVST